MGKNDKAARRGRGRSMSCNLGIVKALCERELDVSGCEGTIPEIPESLDERLKLLSAKCSASGFRLVSKWMSYGAGVNLSSFEARKLSYNSASEIFGDTTLQVLSDTPGGLVSVIEVAMMDPDSVAMAIYAVWRYHWQCGVAERAGISCGESIESVF